MNAEWRKATLDIAVIDFVESAISAFRIQHSTFTFHISH